MPISNNPASWPSGDAIWDICRAVAIAEGANIAGSRPDRNNNPGDVTVHDEWGQPVAGYDGIYIIFASKQAGWQALYNKFANIAAGNSLLYAPGDTWYGIGETYSPGSGDTWAENVAAALGVDPGSTMASYLGMAMAGSAAPGPVQIPAGGFDDTGISVSSLWPESPLGYAAWIVGAGAVLMWVFDG